VMPEINILIAAPLKPHGEADQAQAGEAKSA